MLLLCACARVVRRICIYAPALLSSIVCVLAIGPVRDSLNCQRTGQTLLMPRHRGDDVIAVKFKPTDTLAHIIDLRVSKRPALACMCHAGMLA
jgi:hypothetical protein